MLILLSLTASAEPGFYVGIPEDEAAARVGPYEVVVDGWTDVASAATSDFGGSSFPACPTPLTTEELRAALVAADRHILVTGDSAAAIEALSELETRLPCLDAPVETRDLASMPFLLSAAAATIGALERVDSALAATWAIDPEFEHPNHDASAMRAAAGRLAPREAVPVEWALGEGETVYVDGRPTASSLVRPGRHLVQIVSEGTIRGAWFEAAQPVRIRTEAGHALQAARLRDGDVPTPDQRALFGVEGPFVVVTPEAVLRFDGVAFVTAPERPPPPVVMRRHVRATWLATAASLVGVGTVGVITSARSYGFALDDATDAQRYELVGGPDAAAALWSDAEGRARRARAMNVASHTLLWSGALWFGVSIAFPARVPVEAP
jgi:hypothetical protein